MALRDLSGLDQGEIAADRNAQRSARRRPGRAVVHEPDRRRQLGQSADLTGIDLRRIAVEVGLVGHGIIQHRQGEAAKIDRVERFVLRARSGAIESCGALQPRPAGAGALAVLMIAAHQHDGRGCQQGRGRGEEIRLPAGPIVAPGRAGAALIARRAGAFAIEIVAQMDHQVRLEAGRSRGNLGKWPLGRIVAGLKDRTFQTAAGIAQAPGFVGARRPARAMPCRRQFAAFVPAAIGALQTIGKSALAAARTDIGLSPLSVCSTGHEPAPVTTRAS